MALTVRYGDPAGVGTDPNRLSTAGPLERAWEICDSSRSPHKPYPSVDSPGYGLWVLRGQFGCKFQFAQTYGVWGGMHWLRLTGREFRLYILMSRC